MTRTSNSRRSNDFARVSDRDCQSRSLFYTDLYRSYYFAAEGAAATEELRCGIEDGITEEARAHSKER
jgi:hypothetical protein